MSAQPRTHLISHVAEKGREEIEVMVHSAMNIPVLNRRPIRSYVTGQSRYSLNTQNIGDKPNATIPLDGISPIWNDVLFVETLVENVNTEELILLLIDEMGHRNIAEYRIPWSWLYPFYQYHFEMLLNTSQFLNPVANPPQSDATDDARDLRLFVSITRKQDLLSRNELRYYGLEVLLNHLDLNIPQKDSMYAVARVVPSYANYKQNFLRTNNANMEFQKIYFPFPSQGVYTPKIYGLEGYPQVSLATREGQVQVWNHDFCFSLFNEKEVMFAGGDAVLVIEFYPYRQTNSHKDWRLSNLLGWCAIRLDERTMRSLESQNNGNGAKTLWMVVEGDGSLVSADSRIMTAEVALKLLPDKHPKKPMKVTDTYNMPIINSHYTDENLKAGIDPVYIQSVVTRVHDLSAPLPPPPAQAPPPPPPSEPLPLIVRASPPYPPPVPPLPPIQTAYPEAILRPEIRPRFYFMNREDFSDIPVDYRFPFVSYKQPRPDDVEGWLLYYQDIIQLFRNLVRKMVEDAELYRNQIMHLEQANAQLDAKMGDFQEKKIALLKMAELNEADRANLNKAFYELRTRLAVKSNDNQLLRDQIARLEYELGRKKNSEAELAKMITAHNQQNVELQEMQTRLSKAYGLEDTVKRQELVIEKLESFINRLIRENRTTVKDPEYVKVRTELDDMRIRPVAAQPPPFYNGSDAAVELNLANQKLRTLENQLNKNATRWGAERADLLTRINDLEYNRSKY